MKRRWKRRTEASTVLDEKKTRRNPPSVVKRQEGLRLCDPTGKTWSRNYLLPSGVEPASAGLWESEAMPPKAAKELRTEQTQQEREDRQHRESAAKRG
ncbi:UNVERIFIED_CONTAM: hypothetical protein HHA_462720 [Hammondia hammondi]|eukprot:XP_008888174.1 hypothetical protein HHA_462720 [Hammondia hammondi]